MFFFSLLIHRCFFDKYLATSLVNRGKFSKSMVNPCCLFPVIIFPFFITSDFRKDVLHDFPGDWSESEQLVISQIVFLAFLKTVAVFRVFPGCQDSLQSSKPFKPGSEQPHNNISCLFQHTGITSPSGPCLGSDCSGDPNSLLWLIVGIV